MLRNVEIAGLPSLGGSSPDRLSPMLQQLADGDSVNTGLGLGILRQTTGHTQAVASQSNLYLALKQTLDDVIASLSK